MRAPKVAAAPVSKPATLAFLEDLPCAELYQRSFMHREAVTQLAWCARTDFLATASVEGVVKLWKKTADSVEFAKQFRAHVGALVALCASADGARLASVGDDRSVKLFDVAAMDLADHFALPFAPSAACWCVAPRVAAAAGAGAGAARHRQLLAVAERHAPAVHLINVDRAHDLFGAGAASGTHYEVVRLHSAPVLALAYNAARDCVVSADARGILEVWSPHTDEGFLPPRGAVDYLSKFDTDLLDIARAKAMPTSVSVSPDGSLFAVSATDGRLRLFGFASGKLLHSFAQGAGETAGVGAGGVAAMAVGLSESDLAHRRAVEAELLESELSTLRTFITPTPAASAVGAAGPAPPHLNSHEREKEAPPAYRPPPSQAAFDESSTLLLFPSPFGVHIADCVSGGIVRTLGRLESTERFLGIALYQGVPVVSTQMALARGLVAATETSAAAAVRLQRRADPMLACASFRSQRFFLFSRREPADEEASAGAAHARDVQNEPPSAREVAVAEARAKASKKSRLGRAAVLHTTRGDIEVQLFGEQCPLAVENFSELSRRGYYADTLFHRVIKGFMVQGGDPLGTGTGGDSIFGADFRDEISPARKFDRPGLLAMANAGPNTNGSQFFLTCAPCPWLDKKHTIFGQVTRGMEALRAIEGVRTDKKTDRPLDAVKCLSVEILG